MVYETQEHTVRHDYGGLAQAMRSQDRTATLLFSAMQQNPFGVAYTPSRGHLDADFEACCTP